jgi:hypothetical protein
MQLRTRSGSVSALSSRRSQVRRLFCRRLCLFASAERPPVNAATREPTPNQSECAVRIRKMKYAVRPVTTNRQSGLTAKGLKRCIRQPRPVGAKKYEKTYGMPSTRQKRRRTCERRDERADTEPERVRSPDPQDEVRSQATVVSGTPTKRPCPTTSPNSVIRPSRHDRERRHQPRCNALWA